MLSYLAPVFAWIGAKFFGDTKCHCSVSIEHFPDPSAGVLALLREQLQRCGPNNLGPAQTCPIVDCPVDRFWTGFVLGGLCAIILGLLCGFWAAALVRPTARQPAALRDTGAQDLVIPAVRRPPNARAAA